jgi:hypothetical protein
MQHFKSPAISQRFFSVDAAVLNTFYVQPSFVCPRWVSLTLSQRHQE